MAELDSRGQIKGQTSIFDFIGTGQKQDSQGD